MLPITLRKLLLTGCLFFFIFLLSDCHSGSQNPLLAEWYCTDKTFTERTEVTEDMILRLYPKGRYTQFGIRSYSIGKWRFNDRSNYIHFHQDTGNRQQKDVYLKIESIQPHHLTGLLYFKMPFLDKYPGVEYFFGQPNHSAFDPYRPEINRWRQPPDHPETDAAIRQRVIEYLQFLKALYQHALDNDMEVLNDGWYPKPILMNYSNGVRMAYSNELDDWNQCFYDSAQAVKGYQFISGQVYDLRIKTGVNQFERNLDCVEQLLKGIR